MTRLGVAPSVWVLRAVVLVGILVSLFGGIPEGLVPPVLVVVLAVLGGVLAAFRPEQLAATVALGVVLVWWALNVHDAVPAGSLVAAGGIVVAHVGCTLLGYGPPSMPLSSSLVRVWVVRGILIWLAAPAIWLVARAYADRATPTSFWLAGLAAALGGAVVAALTVRERQPERDR
jgi:hypothetical protein